MRTNALLVSLACLGACTPPPPPPPAEPVDPRPWCERTDYGWAVPNESEPEPSPPTPSTALLGFASIDKDIIRRVIRENQWATERCYQLALEHDPYLQGRVTVMFVIEDDGHIGVIEVVEDTLDDPCVGRCVMAVGKQLWRWPSRSEGSTITIHYPFLFQPP
jgi:hypothetical protein